jgi:phosphoribosylanthranilate isomerase
MKLKVCGMRDSQNIRELLLLKPDYMGFIFYEPSPRNAGEALDEDLLKAFPPSVEKVGVFVNAPLDFVRSKVTHYSLDLVQLHGDESPEYVAELYAEGIRVIKVFSIGGHFDFKQLGLYNPFVEFFLFDTKGKARGGNGEVFDWDMLHDYNQQVPFFLSGGIDLENAGDIEKLQQLNIHAIDVNSRFEVSPGLKDIGKLKLLTKKVN